MDYCISDSKCVARATLGCKSPQDHVTGDPAFYKAGGPMPSCPDPMASAAAPSAAVPASPDLGSVSSPGGPVALDRMPDVQVFVTFTPGRKLGKGRTTMVEISVLDTPGNKN